MKKFLTILFVVILTSALNAQSLALDNAGGGTGAKDCAFATLPGNSCSFTINAATLLVCGTGINHADTISSVTYNGLALTQIGSNVDDGANIIALYYRVNPTVGTHTVASNTPNSDPMNLACAAYTNAATSGNPEANNNAVDTSGTTTSLSVSVSTATAGAWVLTYGDVHAGAGTPTGTGSIINTYSTAATYQFLGDTGVISSPTSVTTGLSNGASATKIGLITISIKPTGGGSGSAPKTQVLCRFFGLACHLN